MKKVLLSTLLGLLILALSACLPAVVAIGLPTNGPGSMPQPTLTQVTGREAHVQSVEIQMTKTEPVQVNVIARGILTESCAVFADTEMSSTNNTFMIKLLTVSPSDRGCLQTTTPFEQTLPLNTTDLPAGEYTVKVNGVSAVFTLPAGNNQTAVPAPTGEPGQTKTYVSKSYGYQVSYPASWSIKVDTSIPAGAGTDPEYVTLRTDDASNLPQINIDVLTGAPPMSGYENCVKNFVFHNLPACQISQPAGQTPAAELWIFQKGTAYFFIGMQYQDKDAIQVFNDFMASFTFAQ